VLEDADGSLLVIDTGGWFYRGCPTSQRARPDVPGGIYRIQRSGMTPLPDPRGKHIHWSELDLNSLVRLLNDTRHVVREAAIEECAARGASMIDRLQTAVRTGDVRVRRNAVWALTRIVGAGTENGLTADQRQRALDGIRVAFQDAHPSLRETACHAAAVLEDAAAESELIGLLQDPSPFVRRKAAVALGRIHSNAAIEPLLTGLDVNRSLRQNRSPTEPTSAFAPQKSTVNSVSVPIDAAMDAEERHARVFAVIEINNPAEIRRLIGDSTSPVVRRAAMTALMEIDPSASIDPAEFIPGLVDVPGSTQLQFHRSLHRVREQHNEALLSRVTSAACAALESWMPQGPSQDQDAAQILLTELGDQPAIGQLVAQHLTNPLTNRTILQQLMRHVSNSSALASQAEVTAAIERLLRSDDATLRQAAVQMAATSSLRTTRLQTALQSIAEDAATEPFVRIQAMQALAPNPQQLTSATFTLLRDLVASGTPDNASRAAQRLGNSSVSGEQLSQLTPLLTGVGPQPLRDLVHLYQRTLSVDEAVAFLSAMENARSLNSLPAVDVSEVVKRFPEELHDRANRLLDQMKLAEQQKLRRLDVLLGQLKDGDAERGRSVFFSEKARCATCHVVGDQGRRVGPDLTTIGKNRSAADLLESIVFPSSTIVRQYEPYTVATTDGRTLNGLIIQETGSEITLQQRSGEAITIRRTEIDELVPATISIMPSGFDDQLTAQQIVDLVAWLQQGLGP
ncbi:MAG: HEAT repeat domain-containing protein, partial [Planctomycetaceae bacterium]|nr:HEAT repeat domain-containing protein [Planctomycetaceae bacterium]